MKRSIWLIACLFTLAGASMAQDPAAIDCPADRVCITLDQARQALVDADTVKAQANEILTLKQALIDQKEVTVDIKIELARVMGEKTGADQAVVRLQAQNEFLLKYGRKRCGVFSLCIQ